MFFAKDFTRRRTLTVGPVRICQSNVHAQALIFRFFDDLASVLTVYGFESSKLVGLFFRIVPTFVRKDVVRD